MRKTILLFAAAAVAAMLVFADDEAPPEVAEDVVWNNRLWIETIPRTDTQKIDVLLAVDEPQIGIFQRTSAYEGDFTAFVWQGDGPAVDLEMLQSGEAHTVHVELREAAQGPFDYALKVSGAPRGATVYYSMADWVIDGELAADSEGLSSWARARLAELNGP